MEKNQFYKFMYLKIDLLPILIISIIISQNMISNVNVFWSIIQYMIHN